MSQLKDHPKLTWKGRRVKWPPQDGWLYKGPLHPQEQLRDPGRARLMTVIFEGTTPGEDYPGLRLRVQHAGHTYENTLSLDHPDFIWRLHEKFPSLMGLSLDEVGEVEFPTGEESD